MPLKARQVLARPSRYKELHGGRGSGKSYAFANALLARSLEKKRRLLCTRELQTSIRDSVHRLLCDRITDLRLDPFFDIKQDSIRSANGSEFLFKGLKNNISEIKSLEGVDICWTEEAERISKDSWEILIPTIRKPDSEIWVSFNPDEEEASTYQRFVKNPPPDCRGDEILFSDNELFPDILRREMEYCRRVDPEGYQHIWLGKPRRYAHALIFKGKYRCEDFTTPEDVQFFFGADWGFSNDPTCLLRMFIRDHRLYIDWESYAIGVEIEQLPEFFDRIPDVKKWRIKADCARPETISYMASKGFNILGAEKGKGSVEDGIEFLRSFEEIVIHSRCPHTYQDYNNYRWKTDKITGLVLPQPADGFDHAPDASRYAIEDYIKLKRSIFEILG